MEFGAVAEGACVAEDAGAQGQRDGNVEADGDGGRLFGEEREDRADYSGSQRLTYKTGCALHASGTTRTVDRGCHHHDDIVGCLEHSEADATYSHTPGDVPFRRITACVEEQ